MSNALGNHFHYGKAVRTVRPVYICGQRPLKLLSEVAWAGLLATFLGNLDGVMDHL